MKKILFITEGHLPVPATLGGAIQTIMDSLISENELNRKFKFTFVSIDNKVACEKSRELKYTDVFYVRKSESIEFIDNFINSAVGLVIKSRKDRKLNLFWKSYFLFSCKKILKKEEFDIVILENAGYLTRIFNNQFLLKKYYNRIYFHLHNEMPNSVVIKNLKRMNTIVISEYLTQHIYEMTGVEYKNNTRLLKNGIKLPKQYISQNQRNTIRETYKLNQNDFVVIFVGRLCEQKGILLLLEAFKKINNQDIKLLIVGSTEFGNGAKSDFVNKFCQECTKLGKRVTLTGYIQHNEIWKYYKSADLAVLPSLWEEAAGLTVIEAMANSIPIITTNCGGIPEYFDDGFGRILNVDEDLAENIKNNILDIYRNHSYWKEHCADAYNVVKENYSEKKYYSNFMEIMND